MKCVAIGGVPATGKTTLVKMIYDKMPKVNFEYGLVKGHYDKDNNIALLGLYNQNNTYGCKGLVWGGPWRLCKWNTFRRRCAKIQRYLAGILRIWSCPVNS